MENQLAVIKKALEMGADIHIRFNTVDHHFTKSQAEEVAKDMGERLGIGYQKCQSYDWFEPEKRWISKVEFSVHYKLSKEDEIQKLKERLARLEQEVTA